MIRKIVPSPASFPNNLAISRARLVPQSQSRKRTAGDPRLSILARRADPAGASASAAPSIRAGPRQMRRRKCPSRKRPAGGYKAPAAKKKARAKAMSCLRARPARPLNYPLNFLRLARKPAASRLRPPPRFPGALLDEFLGMGAN